LVINCLFQNLLEYPTRHALEGVPPHPSDSITIIYLLIELE
jgi:hypothetical protein